MAEVSEESDGGGVWVVLVWGGAMRVARAVACWTLAWLISPAIGEVGV